MGKFWNGEILSFQKKKKKKSWLPNGGSVFYNLYIYKGFDVLHIGTSI